MWDVIIIGAGISGCSIARYLGRYKAQVLVIDKEEDVCCGTTKANSAIVHAGFDAEPGSVMAKLNVMGSRMMPELSKELDFPYSQCGSLVVCLDEGDRPALQSLLERGLQNGVEGLRIVEREELRNMEPNVAEAAVAALYAPTGAIVCPFDLTYAMAENAAANGVQFQFETSVSKLEKTENGWKLLTNKGELEAKVVINAAGVYADVFHNQVCEEKISIAPRRGSYFLLDHTAGRHVTHTIFQLPGKYGKGVLVTPTVHGNLLIGPTANDIEDKDDTGTTADELGEIRAKSMLAVANLPLRQTITSFSGLRAHEKGHDFIIRESAQGFIDCAGIESPGLSAGPAIGLTAAGMAADILKPEENKNFCGARRGILNPKTLSKEEYQELIQREPAYGTMVCRCESITEGEIIDAVHRTPGARSLDGVKRRTRAGMGRCQAGFCSPKVMEILARELGIPMEQVTKSGTGSEIIVGINKDQI
jgi:glycerol-3-phosphate dehydrogenase